MPDTLVIINGGLFVRAEGSSLGLGRQLAHAVLIVLAELKVENGARCGDRKSGLVGLLSQLGEAGVLDA